MVCIRGRFRVDRFGIRGWLEEPCNERRINNGVGLRGLGLEEVSNPPPQTEATCEKTDLDLRKKKKLSDKRLKKKRKTLKK